MKRASSPNTFFVVASILAVAGWLAVVALAITGVSGEVLIGLGGIVGTATVASLGEISARERAAAAAAQARLDSELNWVRESRRQAVEAIHEAVRAVGLSNDMARLQVAAASDLTKVGQGRKIYLERMRKALSEIDPVSVVGHTPALRLTTPALQAAWERWRNAASQLDGPGVAMAMELDRIVAEIDQGTPLPPDYLSVFSDHRTAWLSAYQPFVDATTGLLNELEEFGAAADWPRQQS